MKLSNLFRRQKNTSKAENKLNNIADKGNDDTVLRKGEYTGLCCNGTGVFFYSFRHGDKEVFSVHSLVTPTPDVTLSGFGKTLLCKSVDPEITLIPGIRRYIENDNCGGYLEYVDTKKMAAQVGEKRISITADENGWSFSINSENDVCVARVQENDRNTGYDNGFDTEKRFTITVSDDIDPCWCPFIFGIPMITF